MTPPAWLIEVVQANERIARREAESRRRGPKMSAEWNALFDGQRHAVTPSNPRWFQTAALEAAKRRGIRIHTRTFGNQVVVWAESKEGAA